MLGLNIHLKSFNLKTSLINGNDKVRVSITTFPEKNKEAFITETKQMKHVHHFFTVNISKETEKIIFVFRKVGIFDDSIIASTTISNRDFATEDKKACEMKNINLYEPVQNGHKHREIYGDMQVQFSLTSAFPTFNNKENKQLFSKMQTNSKINGYSRINNPKEKRSTSIFTDDYYN